MVNVNVTANLPGNHIEPSIAVNTLSPNFLVAVSVDDSTGTALTGVYRSEDGGLTWSGTILPQAPGYMSAEAPTIDYTFPNTFIVAVHFFNEFNDGTIATYTSFDNGLTFNPPVLAQLGYGLYVHNDEPFIAVDRSPSSPYRGNAYIGYTPIYDLSVNSAIFFQRSVDQGLSWERPQRISDPRGQLNRAALAVGLAGEVYVGYIQLGPAPKYAYIRVSQDGGLTFSPPVTREATFLANTVPVPSPLPVPNYAFRVQTNLSLGTDISAGPFGGFVYAVWNDFRLGYADIFFSRSQDGLLWSTPVNITGAPASSQNFSPSITVSPFNGTIRVIYYTNRLDGFLLDVFVAESFNSGLSFSNRRLTNVSTNPNGTSPTPVPLIGDYITAATIFPDTLAAVWNDTRTGKQDVIFGN
ncbi:exo-alpha-sialidase [Paenibacillus albidus]|uniref:sialidase family protein n=1 Tax=Paenibacillus albidus TaxID=2041023 RepID=UPI001BE8B5A7|nr:sialidase family protein [Paenibacillus albidus]MBT2291181.1 exo-alpha-sialidase [Paenibacillus albidus]